MPAACAYVNPTSKIACPALALEGATLCAVHTSVGVRLVGEVGIRCYACGRYIRIGSKFLVRAEGAFHLRAACSTMAPSDYIIKLGQPTPPAQVHS